MDPLLTGGEPYEHEARHFLLGSVVTNVQYTIEQEGERMLLVCFTRDGELLGAFSIESQGGGSSHLRHTWITPLELREMDPDLARTPPFLSRKSVSSFWSRIKGRS